ncbi:MAG: hypothetical protein ACKVS5_14070 [Parvularculaceae bacterium]
MAINASKSSAFTTGVKVVGGELVTNEIFAVDASSIGIDIRGGAVEIADGADVRHRGAALQTAPSRNTRCAAAIGKRSIGVFVDNSRDARVGDPVAILRELYVDKFEFGICAVGAGALIDRGRITASAVGIRAEDRIRISNVRVGQSSLAALIALSDESEIIDSKFYDSAVGVFLDSKKLPTFRGNQFVFNGVGIYYAKPIKDQRSLLEVLLKQSSADTKALVAGFTDNEVACNREAGVFQKYRLFRKAHRNRCRYNSSEECAGEKKNKVCTEFRNRLNSEYLDVTGSYCALGG